MHGGVEQRLGQHAKTPGGPLEPERSSKGRRRARPPEQRLGQQLRAERLRDEQLVAEVERRAGRELRMLDGVRQPLAQAKQARGDALVCPGEDR